MRPRACIGPPGGHLLPYPRIKQDVGGCLRSVAELASPSHPLSCKPASAGTKARRVLFRAGRFSISCGAMADVDLVELEASIKKLPDVLGCVILTDSHGRA